MDSIADLTAHLRARPFGRIFEKCNEKDNIIALKLMCILDNEMERLNLYSEIQSKNPKMLGLLLCFSSFASFKYYDYAGKKEIGPRVLRCKFCDLIGPYVSILSHMAISHNTHVGVKTCVYCNRCELEKHFKENTLEDCYQKYLRQSEWHDYECNAHVLDIVIKFFAMLKRLSRKFEICSVRQKEYDGIGYKTVEKLNRNYGEDFPKECFVYKRHNKANTKDLSISRGLDIEFNRVMGPLNGESSNIQSTQHGKVNRAVGLEDQRQNVPMEELQSLVQNYGNQSQLDVSPKVEPTEPTSKNAAASTSFDHQQQLTGNQSPALSESSSTHQRGPVSNLRATPNASSSNIPFGSPRQSDNQDNGTLYSFESTIPVANVQAVYNQLPSNAVQYGLFVAQNWAILPTESQRRNLEIEIETAILKAKKAAFQ